MHPKHDFCRHADECRDAARLAKTQEDREEWQRLAERWERCAESAKTPAGLPARERTRALKSGGRQALALSELGHQRAFGCRFPSRRAGPCLASSMAEPLPKCPCRQGRSLLFCRPSTSRRFTMTIKEKCSRYWKPRERMLPGCSQTSITTVARRR